MFWTLTIAAATASNHCDGGGPGDAGLITLNGSNYGTIGDALEDAGDGDTIFVCQGTYTLSETIEDAITLLGVDGPLLTRLEGVVFPPNQIINRSVLTIDDPNGMVTVEGFSVVGADPSADGIHVRSGSAAQLWDLWVFGHASRGISAQPGADVFLLGTEVFANFLGGIHAEGSGMLGLTGSRVWSNFAPEGAGLRLGDGRVVFGGTVDVNFSDFGGGVFTEGAVEISGTQILNNDAKHDGGGIYVARSAERTGGRLTLSLVTIAGNTAWNGAGIYAEALDQEAFTELHMDRTTISGNHAEFQGGGIWSGAGTVTGWGGEIVANVAANGGGLFIHDVDWARGSYEGLTLRDNVASASGGGIAIDAVENETFLRNLVVVDNRADNVGGGIAVLRPNALINDLHIHLATIEGNRARQGGGIMVLGDAKEVVAVFAMESRIARNTADEVGGVWVDDSLFYALGVTVVDNTGALGAGARVTSGIGYLTSNAGNWSNSPEDVQTEGGGVYSYGNTPFSCDRNACTP